MKIIYSINQKKQIFEILVDDEDYKYLNKFKWRITGAGYARRESSRTLGKQKCVLMHREILGILNSLELGDHIDHDKLNNQRKNLRTCNHNENARNRVGRGKSKYLGVSCYEHNSKLTNKYKAGIYINKKTKHLGYFKTPELAAKAYDKAAKEYFGEFANLNFK